MWFIVRADSRHLNEVKDALEGYVPVMRRLTRPAGKRKPVVSSVPLFPGWVFVPYTRYRDVSGVSGVYGIVKYGRMGPLWLTNQDIDIVRKIEEDWSNPSLDRVSKPVGFAVGDRVRFTFSSRSWVGTISEIKSTGYVTIDIGCNFKPVVDHCLLTPAGVYHDLAG